MPARLIIRLSFGFFRLNQNALQILRRHCGLLVTSEGFTKTNGSYLPWGCCSNFRFWRRLCISYYYASSCILNVLQTLRRHYEWQGWRWKRCQGSRLTSLTCESWADQEWWRVQDQAVQWLEKSHQGPRTQPPGNNNENCDANVKISKDILIFIITWPLYRGR